MTSFVTKPILSLLLESVQVQWLRVPYMEYEEAVSISMQQLNLETVDLPSTVVSFLLGDSVAESIKPVVFNYYSLGLHGDLFQSKSYGDLKLVPAERNAVVLKTLQDDAKCDLLDGEIVIYQINTSKFCVPCIQKPYCTVSDHKFNARSVYYLAIFNTYPPNQQIPYQEIPYEPLSSKGLSDYQSIGVYKSVRIVASKQSSNYTESVTKCIQYGGWLKMIFDPYRCQIHALASKLCIYNVSWSNDVKMASHLFKNFTFWACVDGEKTLFQCVLYHVPNIKPSIQEPSTKKRKLNQSPSVTFDPQSMHQLQRSTSYFVKLQTQLQEYTTSSFTNITTKIKPPPLPTKFAESTTIVIPKWQMMYYLRLQNTNFINLFVTVALNPISNTIFTNWIQNNYNCTQQIVQTLSQHVHEIHLAKEIVRYTFGSTIGQLVMSELDSAIQNGEILVQDKQDYENNLSSCAASVYKLMGQHMVQQDIDEESKCYNVYQSLNLILYPMTDQALSRVNIFVISKNDHFDKNHILIAIPVQVEDRVEIMVMSICNKTSEFTVLNTFQRIYQPNDVITGNNDFYNEILFCSTNRVTLWYESSNEEQKKIEDNCKFFILYSKQQNELLFMFKNNNNIIQFYDLSNNIELLDVYLRFDARQLGEIYFSGATWIIKFNGYGQQIYQEAQRAYEITNFYINIAISDYNYWLTNEFAPTIYQIPFLKCGKCTTQSNKDICI